MARIRSLESITSSTSHNTHIPGDVSMEPLTATSASLKALLRRSPTLRTCRRSTRTFQLHGHLAERSGTCDFLLTHQ